MKRMTTILRALCDTTRLRIVALLQEKGELCVCDLMAALELPQSTISRHLATLRTAAWVADRRSGMWMYYRLHPDLDAVQAALLHSLSPHLRESNDFCDDTARLEKFISGKNCS